MTRGFGPAACHGHPQKTTMQVVLKSGRSAVRSTRRRGSTVSRASLRACLPAELRGPATTITRLPAGPSRAAVYRVDAGGQRFVLKLSRKDEPLARWRCRRDIQRMAADAGLAPKVVHVDERRRAVLSAFVEDGFYAFYGNPRTQDVALVQLGRMLRRVHELPLPAAAEATVPLARLNEIWAGLTPDFPLPDFVGDVAQRVLTEKPPAAARPPVLSHNDANPGNIVYDGKNLLLVDWDAAGRNDPFFDLAAVAVFLCMDNESCRRLLSAYDGKAVRTVPAQFDYHRRLVAVLCGAGFLHKARRNRHRGATGAETLVSAPSLMEFYERLLSGQLSLASGEGQWLFGLALMKTAVGLTCA